MYPRDLLSGDLLPTNRLPLEPVHVLKRSGLGGWAAGLEWETGLEGSKSTPIGCQPSSPLQPTPVQVYQSTPGWSGSGLGVRGAGLGGWWE